jgi:SNF2 family DNA or RNA helicase
MNAEHFSGGEVTSTGLNLVDELMDELGEGKLVVFTQYKMTNRHLINYCTKYNAVAVYGEITSSQQQTNIDRFVNDPTCRRIILQQAAGGVGIDQLQTVCNTVLFLELGYTSTGFEQSVARVLRAGQTLPVTVHIAVAVGTIQKKVLDIVLNKDSVLGLVQHGSGGLRSAVFGE